MRNQKIINDIKRIEETSNSTQNNIVSLHDELIATYKSEIKDLENSLFELSSSADFYHNINAPDHLQVPVREFHENYNKNLTIIKGKLELMVDYNKKETSKGLSINIDNKNTNTLSIRC